MSACQNQRVLTGLRAAGQNGLTQIECDPPHVFDSGPPIKRLAARVLELREQGIQIVSRGRRGRCRIYVLAGAPVACPSEGSPSVPGQALTPWIRWECSDGFVEVRFRALEPVDEMAAAA